MAIRLSPPPLEQSVRAHGTGERSIARIRNLVDDSFLQRRGDRKRIVAPDGSEIVPTTKSPLIALSQAVFPSRTSPVEPEYYIARVVENGNVVTSLPVAAK
jgi:hypothetical protein